MPLLQFYSTSRFGYGYTLGERKDLTGKAEGKKMNTKKWEHDFVKKFCVPCSNKKNKNLALLNEPIDVLRYISDLLSQQKQEIVGMVEGMRKKAICTGNSIWEYTYKEEGYNQALNDLKKKIKEENK